METNDNKIAQSSSPVSESFTCEEIKVTPKARVTFHIDFEDKYNNSGFYDEENATQPPCTMLRGAVEPLETRRTGSFKRKVSKVMQDKDSWNKFVEESRKNDDINKDFSSVAKHLLKKSSIYAVSQVGHAESPYRKILWVLVLSVGLSGCCHQIYRFLTLYFQYPVVINLHVENNLNLEFPAVTICNLNKMGKKYEIGSLEIIGLRIRRSEALCSNEFTALKSNNYNDRLKFLSQYSQLDFAKTKAFGLEIDNLIDNCSFNGIQCSLDHFSHFQSLKYGNCITFNKRNGNNDTALKTSSVGIISGLDLILNLDPQNYITSSTGARVIIHDPLEDPNPEEGGVNISPGYETTLAIKQTCVSRLPAPYKDRCVWYGKDDKVRGNNRNECAKTCIQEQNYARCTCIDPTLPSFKDYKYCNTTNIETACCLDATLDFTATHGLPCDCPLPCFSTTYDLQMSTAVWPSGASYFDSYCDWCSNKNELQNIRQMSLRLKIYYSSLERTIYEQKAVFQDSELLSHLGGQMGLWLGLSLVAAFELIENVLYMCKYCVTSTSYSKRIQEQCQGPSSILWIQYVTFRFHDMSNDMT